MGMVTRTVRLAPTSYSWDMQSYFTVSNPENMLADTDSTTFATIIGNQAEGYKITIVLNGFDINAIPEDAVVSSFELKVKAEVNDYHGANTYYLYKSYAGQTTSQFVPTSAGIVTAVNRNAATSANVTWSDIINAPSGYPQIIVGSSDGGTGSRVTKIYGAEVDVTYTAFEPDTHGIFNLILPRG